MPNDGMKVEFSMDQMRAYNRDREQRDIYKPTPTPSTFDDTQLKKAREVLEQEMAKTAGDAKPADAAPAAPEGEKKDGAEKKKAARIPFFPTILKHTL